MRTAIYVEDDVLQLVCTPDSDFEKEILAGFYGKGITAQIFNGQFYHCRGGWARQTDSYTPYFNETPRDLSLIVRMAPAKANETPPPPTEGEGR